MEKQIDRRLEIYFDESLRDVPKDPLGLASYTIELERSLQKTTVSDQRVRLLGELGVYLRILKDLERADSFLREALQIIANHQLGLKLEIQQKIRLAHVLQWKRDFKASDILFNEVVEVCRSSSEANVYLDFALQHEGKNFFDQNRFGEALVCFEEALSLRMKKQAPQEQIESTVFAIKRTKSRLLD